MLARRHEQREHRRHEDREQRLPVAPAKAIAIRAIPRRDESNRLLGHPRHVHARDEVRLHGLHRAFGGSNRLIGLQPKHEGEKKLIRRPDRRRAATNGGLDAERTRDVEHAAELDTVEVGRRDADDRDDGLAERQP